MAIRRDASLLFALAALAGCAGSPDPIDARSTCHTSDGQFVASPGCTISYSTSRTVTTSTTTTTTVETTPPPEDDKS